MRRPTPKSVYDPRGGRPPKHGGEFVFGDPAIWSEPDQHTVTQTGNYGLAEARAWDRLHPKLSDAFLGPVAHLWECLRGSRHFKAGRPRCRLLPSLHQAGRGSRRSCGVCLKGAVSRSVRASKPGDGGNSSVGGAG